MMSLLNVYIKNFIRKASHINLFSTSLKPSALMILNGKCTQIHQKFIRFPSYQECDELVIMKYGAMSRVKLEFTRSVRYLLSERDASPL